MFVECCVLLSYHCMQYFIMSPSAPFRKIRLFTCLCKCLGALPFQPHCNWLFFYIYFFHIIKNVPVEIFRAVTVLEGKYFNYFGGIKKQVTKSNNSQPQTLCNKLSRNQVHQNWLASLLLAEISHNIQNQ